MQIKKFDERFNGRCVGKTFYEELNSRNVDKDVIRDRPNARV